MSVLISSIVTFDKTRGSDIEYFLYYVENVARPHGSSEEKGRALIQFSP